MWDVPAKEKAIRVVIGIFILGLITVIVLLACGVFTTHTTCSPCATCEPCLESDSCATTKKKYEELLSINQKVVEDTFDGFYYLDLDSRNDKLDNIYFRFYNSTISLYRVTKNPSYPYTTIEKLESINCKFTYSLIDVFRLHIEIPEGQSLRLQEQYDYRSKIFLPNSSMELVYFPRWGAMTILDPVKYGATMFKKQEFSLDMHLDGLK